MIIKLMDWADKETLFDVGDINDIAVMHIKVVTGDEILTVIYKDYSTKTFDSSNCRLMDFFDGEYDIYAADGSVNLLEDERFINRENTFWFERI